MKARQDNAGSLYYAATPGKKYLIVMTYNAGTTYVGNHSGCVIEWSNSCYCDMYSHKPAAYVAFVTATGAMTFNLAGSGLLTGYMVIELGT